MEDEPTTAAKPPQGHPQPLHDLAGGGAELAWAMVDASPDALVLVDEAGLIELVNHRTEVLFGYDRGELLGRPVEMLLPDDSAAVHRAHRTRYRVAPEARAMGSGMDLWAKRADGSDFPVEISLSPLRLRGQTRVIAAVRDVSERRQAEAVTRRVRRGIDAIADGVYLTDPETLQFVYVNHGATSQTGFSAAELLAGMTPQHFTAEFTPAELRDLLAPLLDGSVSQLRFETNLRPRSGLDFPVEAAIDYQRLDKGQEPVLVIVLRDISQRRAVEERARLIQHSIDSVSDAVFVCDERTLEFTYVNQGAVDIHGYSREELVDGMTPADLAPTLPAEDIRAALARLDRFPLESARLRSRARRKDGTTVPVDVQINWPPPTRPEGPRPVVAVVRDVSEQVEHETVLHRSEARFRAAFGEGPVPMTIIEVHPPDIRTMVDVNQALADLFGYTREELIGRPAADLLHPDDVHDNSSVALTVAAGDHAEYANLVRGIRADGSEIWLERHIGALDPTGDQDKLIVHVIDVTREIDADLARRRQQALTAALSDVRLTMLQGASRAEGLELICRSARELLNAAGTAVLTTTDDDDSLEIEASAGIPDSVKSRLSFRTDEGAVGEMFQTATARYLHGGRHPTTTESNREVLNEQRVGPILMAPLPFGDDVAGVLVVVRLVDDEPFTDLDLDPIQQFAAGAVSAIELAKARANEADLELLKDRDRMAREIHDNVIGRLFGTGMSLQATISQMDGSAVVERLSGAVDDIDLAIRDIRAAIYGIRARTEWGKAVRGDILAVVSDHSDVLGFEPAIQLRGPLDELPPPVVEDLLSVLREALTNTAKYAAASSVTIEIGCSSRTLEATISDNGVGFSPADDDAGPGLTGHGLRNMSRRAEALGGTVDIASDRGHGTTVTWTVPLS